MSVKVRFWLAEIAVSLFLVMILLFIRDYTSIAILSTIIALLVYSSFRKDDINFMRLGLYISFGILVVFAISALFYFPLVAKFNAQTVAAGQAIAVLFSPPITVFYSLIISLIFFNLPFIIREKLPKKYFRIFVWAAIVLIVLVFILALIRLRLQLQAVVPA